MTTFDLVAMPWMALDMPSTATSRLRSVLTDAGVGGVDHYANLAWVEVLAEHVGSHDAVRFYTDMVDTSTQDLAGELVFSTRFWDTPIDDDVVDRFTARSGIDPATYRAAIDTVDRYSDQVAARILDGDPDLVGFTVTFQQTYPALCVARRIKAARPEVTVVFGGGGCAGPMGPGLLDAFDDIDLVMAGEAEPGLVGLIGAAAGDVDPDTVPNLVHRTAEGPRLASAPVGLVDLAALPAPDPSAFFAQLEASPIVDAVGEPSITVETSRGCWWGARKHCTFCGLRGDEMAFRAEPEQVALAQIVDGSRRFAVGNVAAVDNILDRNYFDRVLPELAAAGHDLSLFYEIRADLTAEECRALAAAGVRRVQPGIESLVTGTLRAMRKSTTGANQVAVLRDLATEGITVDWNILFGFPGETWAGYRPIVDQLPNLVHLSAPYSTRISLQRFSPNFTDLSLGFRPYEPSEATRRIHSGLEASKVEPITYFFDTVAQGITDDEAVKLVALCGWWRDNYAPGSLSWRPLPDGRAIIRDRRPDAGDLDYELDPLEAAVYTTLMRPMRGADLARSLANRGFGGDRLADAVDTFVDRGLVFVDGATFVALATEARRPVPPTRRTRLEVAAT